MTTDEVDTSAREGPLPKNAKPADMQRNNYDVKIWPVRRLVNHRVTNYGRVEFEVVWEGSYARSSDPRVNLPEELVSRYLKRRSSDGR